MPAARCGRLALHVLGSVFLVSGEGGGRGGRREEEEEVEGLRAGMARRARLPLQDDYRAGTAPSLSPPFADPRQDDYRGRDGRIAEGGNEKRRDRAENTAHMDAFVARLGAGWTCVQPGSGSTQYSPDAECHFTRHADAALVGRGDDRPASLGAKEVSQVGGRGGTSAVGFRACAGHTAQPDPDWLALSMPMMRTHTYTHTPNAHRRVPRQRCVLGPTSRGPRSLERRDWGRLER